MATYTGSCHCGGVAVEFETPTDPAEIELRECQCGFCRAHGAVSASDPKGRIRYVETRPGAMKRYQFGLKSADYILCRECGVYLGAVMTEDGADIYATTNIRSYADRARFTRPPQPAVYEQEGLETRRARRRQRWTPVG
jgi:hypothetical protein